MAGENILSSSLVKPIAILPNGDKVDLGLCQNFSVSRTANSEAIQAVGSMEPVGMVFNGVGPGQVSWGAAYEDQTTDYAKLGLVPGSRNLSTYKAFAIWWLDMMAGGEVLCAMEGVLPTQLGLNLGAQTHVTSNQSFICQKVIPRGELN